MKLKPTEAQLLELARAELGPNCLTIINCLYNTVKCILGYCVKHTKAKAIREKQSTKEKLNAGLKEILY